MKWLPIAALVAAAALFVVGQFGAAAKDDRIEKAVTKAQAASTQAQRSSVQAKRLTRRLAREGRERRDQSCRISERDHLTDVQQLRRTYRYLVHPEHFGDRKGSDLYNVVLGQLSRAEHEAHIDRAPAFCDEPGEEAERHGTPPVGLPEPDPVIPERPPSLEPK